MRLTYRGHNDKVFTVAWPPDGSQLASGSRDGAIQLWNPHSGTCHLSITHPSSCILSLAWSPDGRLLAAGDTAGTVNIWSCSNGTLPVTSYRGHIRFVRSVSWSPDGRYLASGGDLGDSTVQVWEAATGQRVQLHTKQYRIFATR